MVQGLLNHEGSSCLMAAQREHVKWQHTRLRTCAESLLRSNNKQQASGPNAESAGNPQSILMTHCERNRKHLNLSSAPVSFHQTVPPSFFTSSPHQSFPSPSLSMLLCGSWRLPVWCRWFVSLGFSLSGVSWLQWHNEALHLLRKSDFSQDFPFSA